VPRVHPSLQQALADVDIEDEFDIPTFLRRHNSPPAGRYSRAVVFSRTTADSSLVLHAVLGAATVAVSTHFFLWSRTWSAGRGRGRACAGSPSSRRRLPARSSRSAT
jgi:hypothetical protein